MIRQEKRSSFPRFYFLGDEDLLELLGQSTKEQVIQSHLKKIFAGINSVIISNGFVESIKSLHGEIVKLNTPIKISKSIEVFKIIYDIMQMVWKICLRRIFFRNG